MYFQMFPLALPACRFLRRQPGPSGNTAQKESSPFGAVVGAGAGAGEGEEADPV